jgi:copper resistance protein D
MLDALAALCKALLYAALLISAGSVFARATLAPQSLAVEAVAVRWMWRAALAVVVASIAGVFVLLLRLGGQFDAATLASVFSSSIGAALFMQLTGALLLLSATDPSAQGARLAWAGLIALSFAFSGHAATMGPFEGLFVFFHASAAAWWLGSLFVLRFASANLSHSELAAILSKFSSLATRFVGVLVIAGLLLIYALVGFETFPLLSAYERNLAIKLVMVGLVLSLAAYNKFRLTSRVLDNDATAVIALRKIVGAEILVIVLVLIATSILTTYTSPHETLN